MNYKLVTSKLVLVFALFVDPNRAPVAKAGGDRVVVLPSPLVIINGSASSDDKGIVSYLWTRDKSSPAAGVCVHYHSSTSVCESSSRKLVFLSLHCFRPLRSTGAT